MDKLWAPWRIKYIQNKKRRRGCIFCAAARGAIGSAGMPLSAAKKNKDYVVFKTKYSTCMLNIFPYNNGHLMIAPLRHANDFSLLKNSELLDLMKALNKAKALLKKTLNPNGFNIGVNILAAAGAGIASHLHIHIVPRWKGDTNFMPLIFDTKVVSQSLDELYKLLKNAQSKAD